MTTPDDKNRPREFYCNYMAMEESLENAKYVFPKSEWEDIKCYVERTAYDKLQAELEEVKRQEKYWREFAAKCLDKANTRLQKAEALLRRSEKSLHSIECRGLKNEIYQYFAEVESE